MPNPRTAGNGKAQAGPSSRRIARNLIQRSLTALDLLAQVPGVQVAAKLPALVDQRPNGTFRYWQIEPLLNQAADILDRCMVAKRLADDHWVRLAQLRLELQADDDANDELQRERTDGAWSAEAARLRSNRDLRSHKVPNDVYKAKNLPDIGNLKRREILDNSAYNGAEYTSGANGRDGSYAGVVRNANGLELLEDYFSEQADLLRIGQEDKAAVRKEASAAAAENLRQAKKDLTQTGGPLDYESRIDRIVQYQLVPDLVDAWGRCVTARAGLEAIYGWGPKFLPLPTIAVGGLGDPAFVESLSAWVASAIRDLLKLSHDDQLFSVCVPLGPVKANTPTMFDVPADLVSGFQLVRVKGVAAVIDEQTTDSVSLQLWAPVDGYYPVQIGRRRSLRAVAQGDRPPTRIGRVAAALSPRPVEIGGAASLCNAALLHKSGKGWKVEVASTRKKAVPLTIEFQVAGLPFH